MINKLELLNFKAFDRLSLSFGSVNLLTGLNSTGKSTVLQSLLLLKQSYSEGSGSALVLNGIYAALGQTNDVLYEKSADETIGIHLSFDRKTVNLDYVCSPDFPELESSRKKFPYTALLAISKSIHYLSSERIAPRTLYDMSGLGNYDERDFGIDGRFALSYLSEHSGEQVRHPHLLLDTESGSGIDDSLISQTNQWLRFISPDVRVEPVFDRKSQTGELNFSFQEGTNISRSYRSTNVGFGLTNVLPIIIQLLTAKRGETILLENPEIHIHPAGQSRLGEMIARAGEDGIQMIVETHSDHIINGIRLAVAQKNLSPKETRIFFFHRDPEDEYRHKARELKIYPTGQINEWPDGFLDEWEKILSKIMFGD